MRERPFFVGYLPAPKGLRGFLALVGLALLAGFAGAALAVAASQGDPGPGGVLGREDVTGVIVPDGYPLLYVTEGSERLPEGAVVFMSALNKTGVAERAAPFAGRPVEVSGLYTRRGDLAMLQLLGGADGIAAAGGEAPPLPEREDLGRWRLTGEICDGKCYPGAMRPGRGISHKACADLCVAGGVPPVFVLAEPFEGEEYLLVTDPEGGPVGRAALNLAAAWISVEGRVERIGDMLIFRLDPATAARP